MQRLQGIAAAGAHTVGDGNIAKIVVIGADQHRRVALGGRQLDLRTLRSIVRHSLVKISMAADQDRAPINIAANPASDKGGHGFRGRILFTQPAFGGRIDHGQRQWMFTAALYRADQGQHVVTRGTDAR